MNFRHFIKICFIGFLGCIDFCTSKQFLHITDIHLDTEYYPGSADNCLLHFTGMPCCHAYQIPSSPHSTASKWGSYECDTPEYLFDRALQEFSKCISEDDIDFIINTGDNANHYIMTQTLHGNIIASEIVQKTIRKYYPSIPVLNVLGNHDTFPIDQTLPIVQTNLYSSFQSVWKIETDTFKKGGFYRYDYEQLCFITLNSIYYDSNNIMHHLFNETDFNSQFKWASTMIDECRKENKFVWLLNHEPPSKGTFYEKILFKILERYRNTIVHQFFGHRHQDQFLVFENEQSRTIGSGFIPPSFMPAGHDPGLRLYQYNGTHISDYEQYTVSLSDTILKDAIEVVHSYSFFDTFSTAPTTTGLSELRKRMRTNSTLFQKYCDNFLMKKNGECARDLIP